MKMVRDFFTKSFRIPLAECVKKWYTIVNYEHMVVFI